jgi:hypothetical protein
VLILGIYPEAGEQHKIPIYTKKIIKLINTEYKLYSWVFSKGKEHCERKILLLLCFVLLSSRNRTFVTILKLLFEILRFFLFINERTNSSFVITKVGNCLDICRLIISFLFRGFVSQGKTTCEAAKINKIKNLKSHNF